MLYGQGERVHEERHQELGRYGFNRWFISGGISVVGFSKRKILSKVVILIAWRVRFKKGLLGNFYCRWKLAIVLRTGWFLKHILET